MFTLFICSCFLLFLSLQVREANIFESRNSLNVNPNLKGICGYYTLVTNIKSYNPAYCERYLFITRLYIMLAIYIFSGMIFKCNKFVISMRLNISIRSLLKNFFPRSNRTI